MQPEVAIEAMLNERQRRDRAGGQRKKRTAPSPDGTRVVTGSDAQRARIWDALTGLPIRVFVGHTDYLQTVAFSPDGSRILTASSDMRARL